MVVHCGQGAPRLLRRPLVAPQCNNTVSYFYNCCFYCRSDDHSRGRVLWEVGNVEKYFIAWIMRYGCPQSRNSVWNRGAFTKQQKNTIFLLMIIA